MSKNEKQPELNLFPTAFAELMAMSEADTVFQNALVQAYGNAAVTRRYRMRATEPGFVRRAREHYIVTCEAYRAALVKAGALSS